MVIGVVVVVVGGGAAVAWATTRSTDSTYRTATAGPATVTDSLVVTGTIAPVTQATVTFPMSGQVASVNAKLGQQVTVGQSLAQLNTTSLNNAVSSDQSTVASAQAKLASDQTSQTSVSDTAQTTSPSSAGTPGKSTNGLSGLVKSLSGQQNAVRRAQQKVDRDLTLVIAADRSVNAKGAACQDLLTDLKAAGSTTSPTTTATDTSTSTSPTTTPPSAPGGSTSVSDCETLIDEALAAESTTDKDEHALTSAVAALSTALNKVVVAVGKSASSSGTGSTSHSTGTGSDSRSTGTGSTSGGSGGRSGSSLPASADQIAADQAAVDAANAQLAAARQNLAAATLVSPIAGTVADVTITAGQSASANSSTAHVLVIGPGQDEITTAVTDNQVGQVKPGDKAMVTPDGATKPITGSVTQIGALSTTTSSGASGYPVTISLGATSQQLFDGATASVAITLGTAQAAVTVPTSAIHTVGGFSVVTRMVNGTPTTTRVTVGVRGPVVTQVTSGLRAGDQVSLADVSAPMPTSGNTGGARLGGGGGFGGGGLGGGRTAGGGR
jgi:HlyD family secretion protein